jgi:hypothetical protein
MYVVIAERPTNLDIVSKMFDGLSIVPPLAE